MCPLKYQMETSSTEMQLMEYIIDQKWFVTISLHSTKKRRQKT